MPAVCHHRPLAGRLSAVELPRFPVRHSGGAICLARHPAIPKRQGELAQERVLDRVLIATSFLERDRCL